MGDLDLDVPGEILAAVQDLWSSAPKAIRQPLRLPQSELYKIGAATRSEAVESAVVALPAFRRLADTVCVTYAQYDLFPGTDEKKQASIVREALRSGFRSSGAPWHIPPGTGGSDSSPDAVTAAAKLHGGFTAKVIDYLHFIPLDIAAELPSIRFGPCEIVERGGIERFSKAIGQHSNFALNPAFPRWPDFLNEIPWLIVRETRSAGSLGSRIHSVSFRKIMETPIDELTDENPFRSEYPAVVDQALFVLALWPWEEHLTQAYAPWRPFQVSRVFTVPLDPFSPLDAMPSEADVTTEEGAPEWGGERPQRANWFVEDLPISVAELSELWDLVTQICPLESDAEAPFNPLVRHFIVKALRERGIDEFLAHMIAIEAAVGLKGGRSTALKHRIGKLLGDTSVPKEFIRLYDMRGEFVHGRKIVGRLRAEDRNATRSIARKVARSLLCYARSREWRDREDLIESIHPRGSKAE